MIKIVRNKDRYHFETDWLSTYWHFSFDHYYDANNLGFGPLRVFNDDVIRPASGFPTHPHREMEIITYVIEGTLEHRDSTGAGDQISAGEVQRMSAGTGIRHSEYNPSPDTPVHLLQLWIEPSVRGLAPGYEQKKFTREERKGRLLPVASGQDHPGALKIHQASTVYVSTLEAGRQVEHRPGPERRVYIFVIDGEVEVNGQRLESGDQARIEGESALAISALKTSEFMLIDLP